MVRFLLVAASLKRVDRFPAESLVEAQNLRDFLDQAGGYQRVEIYGVSKTGAGLGELWPLQEVLR